MRSDSKNFLAGYVLTVVLVKLYWKSYTIAIKKKFEAEAVAVAFCRTIKEKPFLTA